MTVVYILAHFDDEYCALPLIREARREGLDQRFLYLADYPDPRLAARRRDETVRFLGRQGVAAEQVRHLGAGTGAVDGALHRSAGALGRELTAALAALGPVSRLVTPAWEGGHMDHDTCAFLAVRLAAGLGAPVRQFSLYNGPGLPGPLLRGGAPLAENGPVTRLRLTPGQWLRWMAEVACFPSQLYAWSGIWPALFLGLAARGFGWQALTPERVAERPHPGPLFYERMFRTPYVEVRAALDGAFVGPAGAAALNLGSMAR